MAFDIFPQIDTLPSIRESHIWAPYLDGKIGVMDAIMGQTMGGILFSVLAGQPLIVIMTTAPIALYIKIIVAVAEVTFTSFLRTNKTEK